MQPKYQLWHINLPNTQHLAMSVVHYGPRYALLLIPVNGIPEVLLTSTRIGVRQHPVRSQQLYDGIAGLIDETLMEHH